MPSRWMGEWVESRWMGGCAKKCWCRYFDTCDQGLRIRGGRVLEEGCENGHARSRLGLIKERVLFRETSLVGGH